MSGTPEPFSVPDFRPRHLHSMMVLGVQEGKMKASGRSEARLGSLASFLQHCELKQVTELVRLKGWGNRPRRFMEGAVNNLWPN